MATSLTTTTTLPDQIKEHWDKRLLLLALPHLVHPRWGREGIIPHNIGNTYEWRKFDTLPTTGAMTPLAEGVTPGNVTPSMTKVTATNQFYGSYASYSDRLTLTAYDPVVQVFQELLGAQAGIVIDLLARNAMAAGFTSIIRPGALTSDGAITAAHVMDYPTLVKAMATLQTNNVLPAENGKFICIMHPLVYADILQDDQITAAMEAMTTKGGNPFETGYVGTLLNFDFYTSSQSYMTANVGSGSTVDVYKTIFLGREAYGTAGLSGLTPKNVGKLALPNPQNAGGNTGEMIKPLELIVKPLGSAGAGDPLNQRGTVGWLGSNVTVALNVLNAVVAHTAASAGANT